MKNTMLDRKDSVSMEKGIKPGKNSVDLSLWREFQEGLSALLDMPISLYDSAGVRLCASSRGNFVCSAVKSDPRGVELCREVYLRAVSQVIEKGKTYIYKCHTNQYIFAVPAFIEANKPFVIVGGHTFLKGNEIRDFYEGLAQFGFSENSVATLKGQLATIPPNSIFTIPDIINNLAVPFLKSLRSKTLSNGNDGLRGKAGLNGFHALEQVYKSIAPVLDREELYETILSKSSELVKAERGTLMILDNKSNLLSVKASKGIDRRIIDNLKVKLGEGISGSIAAKGLPVMVRNIEAEVPSWKNRPIYKTKSFISIPLKLDTRVIGVINVSDKISGEVFSDDDLQLLLSFSNYASIALERGAYYSMSEELKMLSMTDPLTGLFNRRYFRERLFEEVERVKRHSECFSTFMIDIDNFKSFNDTYGHISGDEVLRGVSRAIRDAVRSMDVVARFGGEEFAVILPHTNKKDSFVIAERIRKGVEEFRPANSTFKEWPTISLGVAEFPGDASHIDELLHRADSAMYSAKRMGKNRVVVYER
ncbi:MAG: diguanylate cyclase [Deltaproteobacteria bacterium]|nr:diguanylate cyclase [Deltaproteobacteria bacterium]